MMNQGFALDPKIFGDDWDESFVQEAMRLPGPIFIIGASGFIGSKLFFSLISRRSDVYACSSAVERGWRFTTLEGEIRSRLLRVDIANIHELRNLFQTYRPRTVFNLSAYGAYERENRVEKIHAVNYTGVLNLLRCIQEFGCDALVQAGSSSEYGLNCTAPAETARMRPNSDYSVSKGASSLLISYYGEIKDVPCVNLRLYSIYGPWEDRERLIPRLIELGLQSKYPPFASKDFSRDFVYVDDCTRAFVLAALTACREMRGLSINIATGVKTSLEDVARHAQKIFGLVNEPKFGDMRARKWDMSNWYGDPSLAEMTLHWRAETSLEEGLRKTVEWQKNSQKLLEFVPSMSAQQKVSAVVACYRDNEAIPVMHRRLTEMFRSTDVDYEIIFVNDRSPANDEDVIREICSKDSHVVGISHSRNFGSQAAFMSGMEIATGDAVILMDGDLQDPPELIPSFIEKWREGYNIVYGQRAKRDAAFHMQLFYKVFYRMFRWLSDVSIPVDAGDFSLIDRRAVDQLIKLPERDQFIRGLRAWIGFKQIGVPYVRPERLFGRSTNNFLKNIWWAKKAIFSFSTKPLNYVQAIGGSMFGVSCLLILFYLINYLIHPNQNPRGTNTIIILTLGLGGIQMFSLGLLGDYIGKILEEVKGRPKFIRSRIMHAGDVVDSPNAIKDFVTTRQLQ